MAAPYFKSWEPVPPHARFTVNDAASDSGLTEGRVYEADRVGSRIVIFNDDTGRERQRHIVEIKPAD